MPSSTLIKTNLKIKEIENFQYFDDDLKDSLWNSLTYFIESVNDSNFQSSFYAEVLKQMKSFGYRVYTPSQILEFISSSHANSYVIEIVQLELEEFAEWFEVDYEFIQSERLNDFSLNGVTLNIWLKETLPNRDTTQKVLFTDYTNKDKVKGQYSLDFNTGELSYMLKSKMYLTQSHVDSLWLPSAKQVSQYLSDHYMNNYVSKQFKDETNLPYYTYNKVKHKIKLARGGKFTIM